MFKARARHLPAAGSAPPAGAWLLVGARIPRASICRRRARYDHVAAWPGRAVRRPA